MLQSKESDQFETLYGVRLTHVVVVISVFLLDAFFQIPSSFCEKRKEVENKEKNIDDLQKNLKGM